MSSATVAVVGAGLTGLAAVHELRRAGAAVVLVDPSGRPGGVIVTERPSGGWIVEGGPDGFLRSDSEIPQLAHELGVADRIVAQAATGSLAWDGRHLRSLSAGAAAELLAIDARNLDLSGGFATFAGGMGELVDALGAHVATTRGALTAIAPARGGLQLAVSAGPVECAAAILALPAFAAAPIVAPLDGAAGDVLAAIPYHRSANVSLAYRRDQIAHPLDCAGFASDPADNGIVRACTFASSKFPGRAPRNHALLRAFVTAAGADLQHAAHHALAPILGITGAPLWARTFEWERGIPRYDADHEGRVAAARRRLAGVGPIALAGAGYDGAGVSACVRSGRVAARELLARL